MQASEPRVLVTTSRMPFAVDEIHKLGETGRDVTAADTFAAAPGSHSRGARRHLVFPAPTQQTAAFIDAVIEAIGDHDINWLLPMFEEVFYLARHRDRITAAHPATELFFPDFETLARVHDKVEFTALCRELGLPAAESVTTTNRDELREATQRWPHWFARAAYGRGGLDVLTNTGPLAGESSIDDITPTRDDPWLVQEYLTGVDRCSWSVAHHGEIVLHSCYEHPLAIDDRGGIVFESVDSPESLAAAQSLARELNWHGQISFDYLVTDDGVHHMVECNPRPTAGCTVATADEFDTALFDPGELVVVPAGRKKMITAAVLRDALRHPSHLRRDLAAAKGAGGVYDQPHDHLPLLYSALSLQHILAYRKELGLNRDTSEELMATQFFDVLWDGTAIA
ncbi:ATP-grasp domain-containing protein [Gordonia sp. GONU]|uniref:ATP-grasp domain-containing protein n=1 Tax=Gordonia TaxID=2053 RepID=UPI0021ACDB03|nr:MULTISPECIES: ATP-grasp domain-containing protein [Gordonia]MCR8896298.1 ATP-grasp domain-containing protein [Gordonia sp. GONU]MCZ4653658.1 ATP-grasp domain-containing protein [Gordonia amicalis]